MTGRADACSQVGPDLDVARELCHTKGGEGGKSSSTGFFIKWTLAALAWSLVSALDSPAFLSCGHEPNRLDV